MRRDWLRRLALRLVPPDWRPGVASDLDDERGGGVGVSMQAARIGLRLRAARARDRLVTPRGMPLPPPRRSGLMHDLSRDLRFAIRSAFRNPGYTTAVIATLAIGIGANTAIFSVFNWVLFRPLPGASNPHELVTIRYERQGFGGAHFFVSYRDYADLRDGVPAFAATAASSARQMDVATGADPEQLLVEVVTTNYLSMFGVTPALGRGFTADEEKLGAPPTAVISTRLWRRAFAGDRSALEKTVTLEGKSFSVVGVAPAAFQGRSAATVTDVWIPIGAYSTLQPRMTKLLTSRQQSFLGDSFARLRPGVTLAQAQEQARLVVAGIEGYAGNTAGSKRPPIGPVLTPGINLGAYAEARLTTVFRLLMGAVGLLLLLACANAGNLLLARATGRRREIAVCQAIGASRFRIIRQQLSEAFVMSLTAGLAGLALAVWLTSLFDGMPIAQSLPAVRDVSVDWRVCLFALSVSVITALVFATAPAVVGSAVDLQASLKDGITSSRGGRRLLRSALVTLQVTVSVLLLVAAGLFIRTLQNIRALDLGLDTTGVVSLSVQPSRYGYNAERSETYMRSLLEKLRSAPGVDSAAFTWTTPYSANRDDLSFALPDGTRVPAAETAVSPGFFQTMRIPLVAGRDFTDHDLASETDARGTVIISRQLATRMFPTGGAVGAQLTLTSPEKKIVEVVGVVGDVRGRPITQAPEPWAYTPASRMTWGTIQVRSPLPPALIVATIRETARALDPLVRPSDVEVFDASIDRVLTEQRLFARLSAIFAAIGALLAGIGIYGMMAGAVTERRKEFGIRLALGARNTSVLALVLRMALGLAIAGIIAGLVATAGLRRFVESRLYGVTPLDPLTVSAAVTCIVVLSVVASLIPALRAARVDPVRSLRVE